MKRYLIVGLAAVFVLGLLCVPGVMAQGKSDQAVGFKAGPGKPDVVPPVAKGKYGQAGRSNIGHLYLYAKDATTWEIVEGAWGKMKYNLKGPEFKFVFNGHGLEPNENYTLIYYRDPWPGDGLICLGAGLADEEGNVHIMGAIDTGDLIDAKIWLVLSDDVECGVEGAPTKMKGWTPESYLFEYDLINFEETLEKSDILSEEDEVEEPAE